MAEASPRSWWSMSSKQRYSSEKPKSKSPLNSLASAFGLKSKKSPTLAIEDPPLPIQSPPVSIASLPKLGNRPPSKSVSSTLSRADSSEPRTPSDVHHNAARHSLLTLSDSDPFAGRGITTISRPNDPTRLSAYSNSSVQDVTHIKNAEFPHNRVSYASSSSLSQSHANAGESMQRTLSPISQSESFPTKRLVKKSSENNIGHTNSYASVDRATRPPTQPTLHKSGSSNTLLASAGMKRPGMRPRGMTDNSAAHKSGFFVEIPAKSVISSPLEKPPPSSKPISPRVVIRQASLQHLNPPTAPPPRHGLPATPQSPANERDNEAQYRLEPTNSQASSTISFASSTSSRDIYPTSPVSVPERPRRLSDRGFFSTTTSEVMNNAPPEHPSAGQVAHYPPVTLKKVLSQQSLRKRTPLPSSPPQPESNSPASPQDAEKMPSKHRAFPHPRIPMPPIPLSLRPTNPLHSAVQEHNANGSTNTGQKRSSSSSHSGGRKRLFSGSSLRRPSTSHSNQPDDDSQSILSLKSDQDVYISNAFFKPWISTQSSASSFWDEATPETVPNSPIRGNYDFATQQQASVATLGRMDFGSRRQRAMSVRSTETAVSEHEPNQTIPSRSGPEPMRRFQRSNTLSPRSKLDTIKTSTVTERPLTAQSIFTPVEPNASNRAGQPFVPSISPPPMINSLPPPPRPRHRPPAVSQTDSLAVVSLPPSPARPPRAKAVSMMEKNIHRRSIMKKPSFLEIDDDSDQDIGGDIVELDKVMGDSFLDFARESFDTVRST